MTGVGIAPPVHDLLLALAGRVDDDLLAWARELLAVGERDQAVELATAALAAERVALPPSLREALVAAARAARTDLNVERALAPAAMEDGTPHRFDADAAPGDRVVAALRALPTRRLAGCTLHLTWRRTPAGAAPGPLPRAVVLVEADQDRSADLLAYLLGTELDRAGAPASVEVFTAGTPLPAYHVAALRGAREVVRTAGGEPPQGMTPPTADTAEPVGSGLDGSSRHGTAGRRRRAEPEVGPAEEVAAVLPAAAPAQEPAPVADLPRRELPSVDLPPVDFPPADFAAPRTPAEHPPTTPDTDPLNGPLREPLLAPLLDPTGPDDVPAQTGPPEAFDPPPSPVEPAVVDPGPVGSPPVDPALGAAASPSEPAGPDVPDPRDVPDEWDEDWRSGEWAMPRPARPEPPSEGPDEAFDVFGTPRTDAPPPGAELPRRTERTGRLPGHPVTAVPGPVPFGEPSDVAGEVSLFESPTARVDPTLGLRRVPTTPPNTGPSNTGPSDAGQPNGRQRDGRAGPGRSPSGQPAQPGAGRPPGRHPGGPVGPGGAEAPAESPEAPLFGLGAPPAPDAARQGRRRRPDENDTPAPPPEPDRAGPRADAESAALIGGSERDLLAQLQAELAARERRPRPYRRAGQNGTAHSVNGHGHGPDDDRSPPDLAG